MGKTLVVMQPTYMPWIGYFHLMSQADIFVVYDHVQFSKQSWQQRNRLRTRDGEVLLSVPVLTSKKSKQPIFEVEIDRKKNFLKKHLKTIELNYSKAKNFKRWIQELKNIYHEEIENLCELNLSLIELGRKAFDLKVPMFSSRDLSMPEGQVEALVALCKHFECDSYLSPRGSEAYIEANNLFASEGIELNYQNFSHPEYQQINYPDFISHLGFVDAILNIDEAASLIK